MGGKKKGVSVACLSPSLCVFQWKCLSGVVSVELSEGGIWHQTQWVAHHLQCSREARNVGEVPPVHSPAILCDRSRSGRALASRSECVFMTGAKELLKSCLSQAHRSHHSFWS